MTKYFIFFWLKVLKSIIHIFYLRNSNINIKLHVGIAESNGAIRLVHKYSNKEIIKENAYIKSSI